MEYIKMVRDFVVPSIPEGIREGAVISNISVTKLLDNVAVPTDQSLTGQTQLGTDAYTERKARALLAEGVTVDVKILSISQNIITLSIDASSLHAPNETVRTGVQEFLLKTPEIRVYRDFFMKSKLMSMLRQ